MEEFISHIYFVWRRFVLLYYLFHIPEVSLMLTRDGCIIVAVVLEKRKEHPDFVASAALKRKVGNDGFTVPGQNQAEQVPQNMFFLFDFLLNLFDPMSASNT